MPSKWAVRNSMPSRSWHSVGPVAVWKYSDRIRGKASYMASRPRVGLGDAGIGVLGGRLGRRDRVARLPQAQRADLRVEGEQVAQRRGARPGQADDEQRALDLLVVDVGMCGRRRPRSAAGWPAACAAACRGSARRARRAPASAPSESTKRSRPSRKLSPPKSSSPVSATAVSIEFVRRRASDEVRAAVDVDVGPVT